jgi:hypothetical protein
MNGTGQACGTMKLLSMGLVTLLRAPLKVTPLAVGHRPVVSPDQQQQQTLMSPLRKQG